MHGDPSARSTFRRGVILLVVVSMLTVFALIGLSFVLYANATAQANLHFREAAGHRFADTSSETLLNFFLGQLIYGTDDVFSAMRGHSLAETMYGFNADPGTDNTVPYSGSGRVSYGFAAPRILLGQDNRDLINYTWFGRDGFLRDPERYGVRSDPAANRGRYVAGSVSYTYPDLDNLFLGAVRASDGGVLIQSFHRSGDPNRGFGSLGPNNPNWQTPHGKYLILRPRPADHTAAFPLPEDLGGDVKNLIGAPGYVLPGSNPSQYVTNDSVWLDLGFPVAITPDGRKFKPLFAPLIQDLDNRVNLNVHGYWWCRPGTALNSEAFHSVQGWGPWEVNPQYALAVQGETRNLLRGLEGVRGRYDVNYDPTNRRYVSQFWNVDSFRSDPEYAPHGKFYSRTNFDANEINGIRLQLPGIRANTNDISFPWMDNAYLNGHEAERQSHPHSYNFFDPEQNCTMLGRASQRDRVFGLNNLEALLRYRDTNSPALSSDLFLLCPQSFGTHANAPQSRRLVTTHSFDVLRSGVTPWAWSEPGRTYQLPPLQPGAEQRYPSGPMLGLPPTFPNPPANSDIGPDWRTLSAALGRVDLNRKFPAYPGLTDARINLADLNVLRARDRAEQARQEMAHDMFTCLRLVTGAAPLTEPPGTPEYDALRWLAQLAVNIVDYVDPDDYLTPFNWNPNQRHDVRNGWVFGTELPRLVLNEAYIEVEKDVGGQLPYRFHVWAELHNPLRDQMPSRPTEPLSEGGNARLQVPVSPGNPAAYGAYQISVVQGLAGELWDQADNVLGEGNPASVKAVLFDFTPAVGGAVNVVGPQGYCVVGPERDNPGTPQNWANLRVKIQDLNGRRSSLTYEVAAIDLEDLPLHTLLLRRLACPHLPPQPNPGQPLFNPFVTVDTVEGVHTNDAVTPTPVEARYSIGRRQPYAAHPSLLWFQPIKPNQPCNSFGAANNPLTNPFDWPVFMDRPLISVLELLQVSGYRPHEFTRLYMIDRNEDQTIQLGEAAREQFQHRAPWFDSSARIGRLLECLEAGLRHQWGPVGGRSPGRINLNTIWDLQTFQALCDHKDINFFNAASVTRIYNQMIASRTPNGSPGPNDRPFRGMAAPHTSAADGVEATFLRSAPNDPNRRLFEPLPVDLKAQARLHPYLRYELMNKIFSSSTTRSHVFAVWLTVGFFEVVDDSDRTRPPRLGAEIGRAEGRNVRHRMFAVVDRSNLTVDHANPRRPGPRPFFLDLQTPVVVSPGQASPQETITVPTLSGFYEDMPWAIGSAAGGVRDLVFDVGTNREVVTVTPVGNNQLRGVFLRSHAAGCAVSNAVLGNPGPQPDFAMRDPRFSGIVRWISIIE